MPSTSRPQQGETNPLLTRNPTPADVGQSKAEVVAAGNEAVKPKRSWVFVVGISNAGIWAEASGEGLSCTSLGLGGTISTQKAGLHLGSCFSKESSILGVQPTHLLPHTLSWPFWLQVRAASVWRPSPPQENRGNNSYS